MQPSPASRIRPLLYALAASIGASGTLAAWYYHLGRTMANPLYGLPASVLYLIVVGSIFGELVIVRRRVASLLFAVATVSYLCGGSNTAYLQGLVRTVRREGAIEELRAYVNAVDVDASPSSSAKVSSRTLPGILRDKAATRVLGEKHSVHVGYLFSYDPSRRYLDFGHFGLTFGHEPLGGAYTRVKDDIFVYLPRPH